jgi:hypothetical protein
VERGGEPVCRILPAEPPPLTLKEFIEFWRSLPKPDPEYWDDVERAVNSQPPMPDLPWLR